MIYEQWCYPLFLSVSSSIFDYCIMCFVYSFTIIIIIVNIILLFYASALLSCHYELISFLLCHLMDNEFSLSSDLIFDLNFVLEKTQNRIVLKKKKSLVLVEGQSANAIIWQAKEDNVFSGESTAGKPGCYSWNHTCLYLFQKLFKVVVITCFTVT